MKIRLEDYQVNILKSHFFLAILIGCLLLVSQVFSPKELARGDATTDNTAGVWSGTLGPAAPGTVNSDVGAVSNVTIAYNGTFGQYEAGLNTGQTSGWIRTSVISPSSFLKWRQLKLGLRQPPGTTTTATFDIRCGDSSQCTLDNPIVGYQGIPVPVSGEYTMPTSGLPSKIKIQVNFSRPDTVNPVTVLYNWQVSWEVNSGVSLTVSKTPNPANPEAVGNFECCTGGSAPVNNNQVTYTLSVVLNRSVQNLTVELPFPSGTYTPTPAGGGPKTYTAVYAGSTAGGSVVGSKVVWNLGNQGASQGIPLTATFKINSGPPNGMVFKTSAKIFGNDYAAVTLPEDKLNIQSKAFLSATLVAPELNAPSREINYLFSMAKADGFGFQSDMFYPRYIFDYSLTSCLDTTFIPVVTGSGTTTAIDTVNRRVTFTLPSPVTLTHPSYNYSVRLRAAASCTNNTVMNTTLTFSSEQDSTFVNYKTVTSNWEGGSPKYTTSTAAQYAFSKTGPSSIGAGESMFYNLWLNQRSTVPIAQFYTIDRIPTNTTFIAAQMAPGFLKVSGVNPVNWRIYYSTKAYGITPPTRTDTSWVELANGPVVCNPVTWCTPSPAPGSKINWIKFDANGSFNWDRDLNYAAPIASVKVVTDSSVTGFVNNSAWFYSNTTCLGTCPTSLSTPASNTPYFALSYINCHDDYTNCWDSQALNVSAGSSYRIVGIVQNAHDYGGMTHGDATNAIVSVRLPDRQFLDPGEPIDLSPTQTYARCSTAAGPDSSTCPIDTSGTMGANASWLTNYHDVSCSGAGTSCTISWKIPIIYSVNKYPTTLPYEYHFYVRVKTRAGVINNTTACNGICSISVVSSTPNNPKMAISTREVLLTSSPKLEISKELVPEAALPGNKTPIAFGGNIAFRIKYRHTIDSSGAVSGVTLIDAIPENGEYVPPQRMIINTSSWPTGPQPLNSPSSYTISYMLRSTTYPTSGAAPLISDPGWKTQAQIAGQENLIAWVKWDISQRLDLGQENYVDISLKDQGSPNGTQFNNRAFITYPDLLSNDLPEDNLTVSVSNPGFTATDLGDVGSIGRLGSDFLPPTTICQPNVTGKESCNSRYLAISGDENYVLDATKFTSFKNWLVSQYEFSAEQGGLITNYKKMWDEYGKDAVSCNNETNCFTGPNQIVKYTVVGGNTLKINSLGNYTGVPKIVFVDGGNGLALEINANFTTAAGTGLIFIVNGDVKVHPSVENVDGVFLVEGKFSTGRRAQADLASDAGAFATISVGRDGYSRIVYLAGSSLRFIKCSDTGCVNRAYEVLGSTDNVTSINMELYENTDGKDYPRIVVGRLDGDGNSSSQLIICDKDDCLDKHSYTYDANDPDIAIGNNQIRFSLGNAIETPRPLNIIECGTAACLSQLTKNIDGGGSNSVDKGNETNIGFDTDLKWAATYIDRSAGKSDLWLARAVNAGTGTGCSNTTDFTCKRISASPGNIEAYHASSWVSDGSLRIVYVDSVTHGVKNILCYDLNCNAPITLTIDCGTAACQGQRRVSAVSTDSLQYALYNVQTSFGNEVKLGFCYVTLSCEDTGWTTEKISNATGYSYTNSYSYTHSIALGRVVEVGIPRIVFNNQDNGQLIYVRCKNYTCSSADPYVVLDNGATLALKDKQLRLNGSVIAYGATISGEEQAINLERDLFADSKTTPAEIFTLQPKYYYIFRQIIKEPQQFFEKPP